jgi:hypothetical protein
MFTNLLTDRSCGERQEGTIRVADHPGVTTKLLRVDLLPLKNQIEGRTAAFPPSLDHEQHARFRVPTQVLHFLKEPTIRRHG